MAFRYLNRDGSFNVVPDRRQRIRIWDLYHFLLSIQWRWFLIVVGALYFLLNLIFGAGYFLCGPGALEGARSGAAGERFLESFFFSVQTFATIGYGRISPVGLGAHILVTLEALCGLFSLAVVTGLVFARFARPTARVMFSQKALMTTRNGQPALIFRIANQRTNQIVSAKVSVTFLKREVTAEGITFRNLYDLPLLRNETPLFGLMWTVIHTIDEKSPLYGADAEKLKNQDMEILVSLTGLDDILSQTVHARFSYTADDLHWGGQFADMLSRDSEGRVEINMQNLNEMR